MSQIADVHTNAQRIVLLAPLTISTAIGATVTDPIVGLAGSSHLAVEAKFLYGAGGTNATVYVQTSLDGGLTWFDIMCFQFTTAAASKLSAVSIEVAPASQAVAPTDGTLTANTVLNGFLGDRLRLKYVTTGTYSGATFLTVYALVKG